MHYKWGISGNQVIVDVLSKRAESQVRALNRGSSGYIYEACIVEDIPSGTGARLRALGLERQLVYSYKSLTLFKPVGNKLP